MGRAARARRGLTATPRMLDDLPNEGARIVVEGLRRAFANVTRNGGMSWGQSIARDYASEERERAALAADRDANWEDVANDPVWPLRDGLGGWSFLDPVGRRYYLPAGLARILLHPESDSFMLFCLFLTLERDAETGEEFAPLTPEQRAAVATTIRFITESQEALYGISRHIDPEEPPRGTPWRRLYERAWRADEDAADDSNRGT